MTIKLYKRLSIIIGFICFISCGDSDIYGDPILDQQIQCLKESDTSDANINPKKTVYVTGYIGYYDDGAEGALAWRNGLCSVLIDNGESKASCITFDNDTLYLVSNTQYFKNGIIIPLSTNSSEPYSSKKTSDIAISNHDVYISGSYNNRAVYWKNGIINILNGGTEATGIYVTTSNDVYVSGINIIYKSWKDITSYAQYWKNGQMHSLGTGVAYDIAIKDTDVYVLGYQNGKAVLWKNGLKKVLSETSNFIANHIELAGNDIIISGKVILNNKEYAAYWKNDVLNQLNSDGYSSQTTSIFIDPDNNDLYISGNIGDGSFQNAVYWKNGILSILPANVEFAYGSKRYSSTDIYVK